MKAFVFVNDNGAAFSRYKKNEIPAQFVYGVSKLEKMGFEVMVGRGIYLMILFHFGSSNQICSLCLLLKEKRCFFIFWHVFFYLKQSLRVGCISMFSPLQCLD